MKLTVSSTKQYANAQPTLVADHSARVCLGVCWSVNIDYQHDRRRVETERIQIGSRRLELFLAEDYDEFVVSQAHASYSEASPRLSISARFLPLRGGCSVATPTAAALAPRGGARALVGTRGISGDVPAGFSRWVTRGRWNGGVSESLIEREMSPGRVRDWQQQVASYIYLFMVKINDYFLTSTRAAQHGCRSRRKSTVGWSRKCSRTQTS